MAELETIWITPEGWNELQVELERLRRHDRPQATERLRAARELNNDWESPGVRDTQQEVARVEQRIRTLEAMLARAEIAYPRRGIARVAALGTRVTVRDEQGAEEAFTLVDPVEVDPLRGRVSIESPVGRALLNGRPGDRVGVSTPGGLRTLEILAIEWPS